MSMIIDYSKIENDKPFEEYPEDTVFVMRDSKPRYILDPFEIIPPHDPRYKDALSLEEAKQQAVLSAPTWFRAVFLYPKVGVLSDVSASRAAELTAKVFAAGVKPKQIKKIITAWILSVFCPTRFDIF